MSLAFFNINAQDTISTTFPANNSASGVSFEVEANSSIVLSGILNAFKATTTTADVWIRWGGVDGIAGDRLTVTAANGWSIYQSSVNIGSLVNGLAPLLNFNPLSIPAGTKVGIVLAGSTNYSGSGSTPLVPDFFNGTHAVLRAGGPTTGFGGSIPNMANDPRGFVGSIIYQLDVSGACANSPTLVAVDSITATNAKIDWVPGSGNSSFWLEYGLAGFSQGTGTIVSGILAASQPPVYLTNLTLNTDYEFYLGEVCSNGTDSVSYTNPHTFKTTKLCPEPNNLTFTNVGGSSATVNWNYSGSTSNFTVYYGLKGDPIGSLGSFSASGNTYSLTGLFGNTEYDVYVTADCGSNGISDTTGAESFLTACGPMSTPFTESFDTTPTGSSSNPSEPNCWNFELSAGASGWAYNYGGSTYSSGFARGGTGNSFRIFTSSHIADGDSMAFVSPQIANMSTVPKQVEFWSRSRSTSSSYDVKFVVGTVAGHNMLNTFVPMDTISIGNNTTYQHFTVLLTAGNGYNGSHEYVAFFDLSDGNDHYHFDDITFSDAPACLPSTNIAIGNISSSGATLTWTPGQGLSQQVEYGPTGFLQGTGTIYGGLSGTFDFPPLAGDLCYEAFIRDSCSNGYGPWVGPLSFCTLCDYFPTPINEGFENSLTGTNMNPSQPDCWDFVHTSTGNGYGFTFDLAGNSNSGSNYFYTYTNDNPLSNDLMGLVSPGVQGLTNGDKEIGLWARSRHAYAIHDVKLIIGTVKSPLELNTFVPLDTFQVGNSTTYAYFKTEISTQNGYNGSHDYIAILDNSATGSYAFIDDISISDVSPCAVSSNIQSDHVGYNTARITWDQGQGLSSNVEYGQAGFSQGSGIKIYGAANGSQILSNLSPGTCYDVYVQDSCAIGLSPWFGPISFCTGCSPVATPYLEDFEAASVGSSSNPSPPTCWSYWEAPGNTGYGYTSTSGSPNGNQHFRMYSPFTSNDTIVLISPAITGLTNSDKKLSFYSKTNGIGSKGAVIVGTSPYADDLRFMNILDTITTDSVSYLTKFEVYLDSLSGYNGTDEYIFLMHGQSPNHTLLYVEDIQVEDIPPCTKPWNLNVSNISGSGATFNWSTLTGTGFRVEFGPAGFSQGSGTTNGGTIVNSTSNSYTATGLNPNTIYQFYVSDNCDLFDFAGPFSFQTPCSGPISGTFTVGKPNSDFETLDSAISVLKGCGVNGPVVLNLQGGLHNTLFDLDYINGVSAVNTVSLVGGTVSGDTLWDISASGVGIELDSTQYVNFVNITIIAPFTSRVIWMHNDCSHITFDKVNFIGSLTTTSSHNIIVASSSPTFTTSGGKNISNFTMKNCYLYGGYHGAIILGQGANNKSANITIDSNVFTDQYFYGLRMYNTEGVFVRANKIKTTGNSSYALTFGDLDDFEISANEANGGNYGLYIDGANKTGAPVRSLLVNNMFIGDKYGIYFKSSKNFNIYHNSVFGTDKGIHMEGNFNKNFDMVNNIVSTDLGEVIHTTHVPQNAIYDYNVYYTNSGANAFEFGSNTYSTLNSWKTGVTGINDSSLFGDPVFQAADDLRINLGTIANNKGDTTLGVNFDIDHNSRPSMGSVRVDIGAYEYTPYESDLSLLSGHLVYTECLSSNDTVLLKVHNYSGQNINMASDSIVVNWQLTGPINSNGLLTVNSGNLALGDTLLMKVAADFSIAGFYTLNAYLEPSLYNTFSGNDTLIYSTFNIEGNWEVHPKRDSIYSLSDSVDLKVQSSFLNNEKFFITEICHNIGSSVGQPSGGAPSWLIANDYIEISGIPGSDLEGVTLEQWTTSGLLGTHTFPKGTVLNSNGQAIIAVGGIGSSVPSPANFYYHGNGTHFSNISTGALTGRVLKNSFNQIIDAVGYGDGFQFPLSAGVATSDWSGHSVSGSSSWGIRLEGVDNNNASTWVQSTQNPGNLNTNVSLPVAPVISGFTWSKLVNGSLVLVANTPSTRIGENSSGIFLYIANYTNSCGTFTDTVVVHSFLAGCPDPFSIGSVSSCSEVIINWSSDPGTTNSYIEYGNQGFVFGTGTPLIGANSPQVISGLLPNTVYDFYIIDSCVSSGFGTPILITDTTLSSFSTANFTWLQTAIGLTNAQIDFDASSSANALTYSWDYGDGSALGTGMNPNHTYSANGSYQVTLTVNGPCDTTNYSETVTIAEISVDEMELSDQLYVFPNPSKGSFIIEFKGSAMDDVGLKVFNSIGQEIYVKKLGMVSTGQVELIDLNGFESGVYFIEVSSQSEIWVKKIVLKQ